MVYLYANNQIIYNYNDSRCIPSSQTLKAFFSYPLCTWFWPNGVYLQTSSFHTDIYTSQDFSAKLNINIHIDFSLIFLASEAGMNR